MAKDLSVSVLLDFYGELLTPKQAEALDLYYNQDLSLAEIADDMGVSRQGVRAFIKQGEAHLVNFEEKLGLMKNSFKSDELEELDVAIGQTISEMVDEALVQIGDIKNNLEELMGLVDELCSKIPLDNDTRDIIKKMKEVRERL